MNIHRKMNFLVPAAGAALVLGAMLGLTAAYSFSEQGGVQNQDERITRIRELYARVQDRIALAVKEAEGGSPPEFYSTEVFVNSRNGSWRASGTYSKKTVFWYTDEPEFAGGEPGGELSVMAKIEIEEIVAVRAYYREFLFDKGKLVFAFIKNPGETGGAEEFRYYFADGVLFRYMEGPKVMETKPDTTALKAEIKRLQELFLSTF